MVGGWGSHMQSRAREGRLRPLARTTAVQFSGKTSAPGKTERSWGAGGRHRTGIGGGSWRQAIASVGSKQPDPGRQRGRLAHLAPTPRSSPGRPGETWEQWAGSVRPHLHTPRRRGGGGLIVKH